MFTCGGDASVSWLKSGSWPISTICMDSVGGASAMTALAILRLSDSLRRLPTKIATFLGAALTRPFLFADWEMAASPTKVTGVEQREVRRVKRLFAGGVSDVKLHRRHRDPRSPS